MADFSFKKIAHKECICQWCRKTIKTGDVYIKVLSIFINAFKTRKECIKCNKLLLEFYHHSDHNNYIYYEDLNEFWKSEKCTKCNKYNEAKDYLDVCMTHYVRCDNFENRKE